jgi:hypothetical protein
MDINELVSFVLKLKTMETQHNTDLQTIEDNEAVIDELQNTICAQRTLIEDLKVRIGALRRELNWWDDMYGFERDME